MEAAGEWAPLPFQFANWDVGEDHPAAGLPVDCASIDIFGTCGVQEGLYVPEPSVEYCYYNSAASQRNATSEKAGEAQVLPPPADNVIRISEYNRAAGTVFEQVESEFEAHMKLMKKKMHRYPATLRAFDESYTVPRCVAIGPYHHHRLHLKQAEKAKHVAAIHCVRESGHSVEALYSAVASAADDARSLYDKDVMAGISYQDFRDMMFFDACFLVQYMAKRTPGKKQMDPFLRGFLDLNGRVLVNDVMLLENQLPWQVMEIVMGFRPVSLRDFVAPRKWSLQSRRNVNFKQESFVLDDSYQEPPHLLGLLRHYIVGTSRKITDLHNVAKIEELSYSISAIELAEVGITLTANETVDLANMGLKKKGILFAELSLAPLSLNHIRASRLINMAALELCTFPSYRRAAAEDSAVCSYLRLLSMLAHREEDVQELRKKGILQGGAGLNNKEALDLFTSLQTLPIGSCYVHTMLEIESYRVNRRMETTVHAFFHKKKNAIVAVLSTIVAVVSIFGTLVGILVKLK